ncbi:MAG: aminopeptidase [Euryarchaeota archaeon]|nr:aminopeptidase [Euryarchaeota archaeon]
MTMIKGAKTVTTQCLDIKPHEKVLILTDIKMLKIGKILYEASREISNEASLVIMEPRINDGEEPPEPAAEAMRVSDVVIAPTFYSLTHTKARIEACKNGARIASMPRITQFSFTKGGLTADYQKVRKLTEKMFNLVKGSKVVKIQSKSGTDVSMIVAGRKWYKDTGIIHKPGEYGNLPGGEVFIAPIEESVNGKIVFDSFGLAKGKIELAVINGIVKEVKGKAKGLLRVFDELGEKARAVAEFGIGTNPKAKVIGNILEDEKVTRTCHIALGGNIGFGGKNEVPFHMDGILLKPTIKVDDKILIEQ